MRRVKKINKKQVKKRKRMKTAVTFVLLICICFIVKAVKGYSMVNTNNYDYTTLLINRSHRVTKSFIP